MAIDVNEIGFIAGAIFNELYFVSDGGTVWLNVDNTDNIDFTDPR